MEIGVAVGIEESNQLLGDGIHGTALSPFTDINREWELDRLKPSIYNASIFYMKPDPQYETEKPYFFNIPVESSWLPKVKQTNVCYTRRTVAITDIRGHQDYFMLDRHGFQIGIFRTGLPYDDFASTDTIVSRYYEEVKHFLKQNTGAVDVLPFDFQVRRKDPTLPLGSRGAPGKAQPFAAVHGDQTTNAAFRRLKHFHPEFAQKYTNNRFQIVNVWKPLKGPVHDSPLALCDYRTVKDEDRVPTDIIFPDYLGETYNFWPNPHHRFYFIDRQLTEEAWMVKCFDSESARSPEIAQFAPHVSFPYGRLEDDMPKRESIEGSVNLKILRFEITAVYKHPEAIVDVVLIHGLNGHPKNTWTTKDGIFWPTDFLPPALRNKHTNVLVYGYNANVYSRNNDHQASNNSISQHAETLVTTLAAYRRGDGSLRNPIIWIAHSLGGILLKCALLYSNDVHASHHGNLRSIYVSTYGIIFLGTPHTGSGLTTWGRALQAMADVVMPRKLFVSEPVLLKTLKRDSEQLREINSRFLNISERFKIHMVHENHKTRTWITQVLVVDATSASPQLPGVTYYGIEATHSGMCKFESTNAPGFHTISTAIRDWVTEAPRVIEVRWRTEERDRWSKVQGEIDERRMSVTPHHTSGPEMQTAVYQAASLVNRRLSYDPKKDSLLEGLILDQKLEENVPNSDRTPINVQALSNIPSNINPRGLEPCQQHKHHEGLTQSLQTIDAGINAFTTRHQYTMLPEKIFGIPYPRNRWFTGREAILSDVRVLLVPQSRPTEERTSTSTQCSAAICVVHGLPGIGKTNLAIEFGYQQKHVFSHIFWISSDSEEKFDDGFLKIARSLKLVSDTSMEDKEAIVNAALMWLKTADPKFRWLLILDNVDNAQLMNPLWSDLHHGSVLITSRDPIPEVTAVTQHSRNFRLLHLLPDEGAKLIKGRLGAKIREGIDDSSAADLAKRFEYYPLYMDQMTSFIESSTLTLAEFYEQLESESSDNELQDFHLDTLWYRSSVAKAIESHMAKLSSFDFEARNILSVIAFFDPDSIPEGLLLSADGQVASLSSTVRRQKVLSALNRPSFIYFDSGDLARERRIRLHRLVRDAALRSELSPQKAFDTAVVLLRNSFPLHGMSRDHMVEDWAKCETFQPHVLSLHQHYLDFRDRGVVTPTFKFIELIYSCAWYLCERGRFTLSKTLISSIYDDYIRLRDMASVAPAEFLADILTVQLFYHNETEHEVSLVELATQAMEIREEAVKNGNMDDDHPNRANGPMNVGVVLALKSPERAIEMHTMALEIRLKSEKYKAEQIHGLALNYLNVGRCWWVVGELEKAALCFEESLHLWKKRESEIGTKFSLTALALLALGIVRADQNDFETAMQLMSESLELHIRTIGQCHRKTLMCYYRLGRLCHRIGENDRAEQLLSICLDAYSLPGSPPKAELARTKFQLAKVMKEKGASEEKYLKLDYESRLMLSEVLKNKGVVDIQSSEFVDVDFDDEVDYYLR
ncbi:hypothetical protein NUW58_g1594 [Xylaria curta]|uniref:Uncharacterized protein n=2 Tax=Xylaria curta TaxID=42375 RepID=A0ACC1P5G6_9PEZI|nr:hypothetical protein NUW58_g5257 [Xylaria curta]KAJ2994296.1 hypothetical protein NUW58_g1594 [Xylaria curta]